MGHIASDNSVDRVRQATDVVALIREFLPLKKAGSTFKALCPFHKEKTPSFTVNPERQIFKCFGCGEGGDVFSFIMKMENVDFPEALRILADRANIELPERGSQGEPGMSSDRKSLLYRANQWAAAMFHRWLLQDAGRQARDYLHARGVSDETIGAFQLGYAPGGWSSLLDASGEKNIPQGVLAEAGLLSTREHQKGYYDRFRNRLMFPIRDVRDRVIAFGARALDDSEPKYLNSPETPLFSKGRTLYGLNVAREDLKQSRRAIVVEGYMDVIMAHQHGVRGAVGVLGTALTRDHVRLLQRYVEEAALVFDADSAGQNSADRSIDAFAAEELSVRVVTLANGLDPDEFLRELGVDAFRQAVDSAEDGIAFKLHRAMPQEAGSATQTARALDDVLETVALIPNAVAQSLEIRRISTETGVGEDAIRRRVGRLSGGRRYRDAADDASTARTTRRDAEDELLQAMLAYPRTVEYVRARVHPEGFVNETVRELARRLFELYDETGTADIATLLGRTRVPEERMVLEEIIGRPDIFMETPEDWCRDLINNMLVRQHRQAAAEFNRIALVGDESADATDAKLASLQVRLQAMREAQDTQGNLKIKNSV